MSNSLIWRWFAFSFFPLRVCLKFHHWNATPSLLKIVLVLVCAKQVSHCRLVVFPLSQSICRIYHSPVSALNVSFYCTQIRPSQSLSSVVRARTYRQLAVAIVIMKRVFRSVYSFIDQFRQNPVNNLVLRVDSRMPRIAQLEQRLVHCRCKLCTPQCYFSANWEENIALVFFL